MPADFSGVPACDGFTDLWHPTQSLADLLTMHDHAQWSPAEVSVCFLGDATNNSTGNPKAKVLHCLPSFRKTETAIGHKVFEKRGREAIDLTDDVFESPASLVFDERENRLHTIKAFVVAPLAGAEG